MIVSSSCHCTLSDSVHVNKETDWCLSLIFIFCSTRVRWCCHEMTDKLLVSGQNIFLKRNMFLAQRWLDEKYLLVPGVHITEAGDTECLKIIWRLQWSYYRMAKLKYAESPKCNTRTTSKASKVQWWKFELLDTSATSKATWWNFALLAESLVWHPGKIIGYDCCEVRMWEWWCDDAGHQ